MTLTSSQEERDYNTCTIGTEKEQHPFYIKSNWNPPVLQSVALESNFEEVKISLAEINLTKPKDNLLPTVWEALRTSKGDEKINLRKADKGTNTVVMTKEDKLNEGPLQLNVREQYRPLESPMIEATGKRVLNLINKLYQGSCIDGMTKKWLSNTYSASNTDFPHPDKNPQTYTSSKTNRALKISKGDDK